MILNRKGVSLIEVMVSAAIAGIVAVAMMSLMSNQSKEAKAIGEKLAALELERSITQVLSNPGDCGALFLPANVTESMPIPNAAGIDATHPLTLNLKTITVRGQQLAAPGSAVSPMSPSLKAASIQLQLNGQTTGTLKVKFDETSSVRLLKELSFPVVLATDWPTHTPNMNIVGCLKASTLTSTPTCVTQRFDNAEGQPSNGGVDGRYHCPAPNMLMTSCTTLLSPSGMMSCGSWAGAGIDPEGRAYCTEAGCGAVDGQYWSVSVTCCSW